MNRPHIALIGPARAGKDTTAHILTEDYGYHRMAFADRLREFVTTIDPHYADLVLLEGGYEAAKTHQPEIRARLVDVGDAARTHIHSHVWIDALDRDWPRDGTPVVVTDVRHPNEVDYLGGCWFIRVVRPGCYEPTPKVPGGTYIIDNNGSVDELRAAVHTAMATWNEWFDAHR
ncbi:hypothetical protein [Actinopolyspora halophila]|uniref:hypothetical protein n=1 Tax=Actinopolyspora halophila TaxID=1850 RepID=UPI0003805FC1|nr:hypothetical protein [Actinopolyspora halophila]